jgi:subtilisin family serine protease
MCRTSRLLARLGIVLAVVLGFALGGRAGADAAANDPVFVQGLQWGLERIDAPAAWTATRGSGVTIAIVDSGIDLQHEDLKGKVVASTACIGTQGDPRRCSGSAQDDNGHGTHVAGIAAATTDNHRGIAGVAPDAKLIAVRVLTNTCNGGSCSATGTSGDVAAGIRWATDHGADVINLSLGGGTLENALGCTFCSAIDYAWSKGVVVVVAAGNDSLLPTGFGNEPAVVVTATTRDDARASYSNSTQGLLQGARWPVAAPGGEGETDDHDCGTGGHPKGILSTYWIAGHTNEYACLAGTSMAAPHVSGVIALLLAQGRSPQNAIDRVLSTAHDLGPPGRDGAFGVGLVDAAKAVGATAPASTTSTVRSPTSTGRPTTTQPPSTATTTPSSTTPEPTQPPGTAPATEQAVQLHDADGDDDEPPAPLVAVALGLVLSTGATAAAAAWRLRRIGAL